MMKKASLDKYFEFYISNEDVKNGKPNPEMYNKAIKMLNLTPQECMIIEDNENGIKAAKASHAWVMEVDDVKEVNHENIINHIKNFEEKMA
jgi:HAD superfamily hydrolase (TIGR01509 family)